MKTELIQTPEEWQLLLDNKPAMRSKKLCSLYKVYLKFIVTLEEKILKAIGSKKEFMKRDIEKKVDDIRDFDEGWYKLKKEGIIEFNFLTKKWTMK